MPNTFFGLSIGKSGLYASQAGINTTAHNISNTEKPGYTRQVVQQSAPTGLRVYAPYGIAGAGTDVTGVKQIRDEYYDLKYWKNSSLSGSYSTKSYYMTQIENHFNEIKLEGFTTTFNKFHDSLQEMTKNPADLTARTQATNLAQSYCEYFNYIAESMEQIQSECNFEVKNQIERINSIGMQIASLSKQINHLEVGGGIANDLRDDRNLLIDELSTIVNVSVSEKPVGAKIGINSYVVRIDGHTLVDDYTTNRLIAEPREEKINQTDATGLYDIRWENGVRFNLANVNSKGTLQALIDVRDGNNGEAFKGKATSGADGSTIVVTSTNYNDVIKMNLNSESRLTIGNMVFKYTGYQVTMDEDTGEYIYEFSIDTSEHLVPSHIAEQDVIIGRDINYKGIPYYMSQMNEFVRTYSKAFNDVHKTGVDLNGDQGLDFFNGKNVITGENFILSADPEYEENGVLFTSRTGAYLPEEVTLNYASYNFLTAKNFCITSEIYKDANKVAAASSITDGVENADIVNQLIELKNDITMFRQGSPSGFLQTLVAEIGIDTYKSNSFAQNQQDIVASIENQRLQVSGVDADEEAMNLVKYQSAYNLSAKVVSVMNEIYDKLINYMGA